MFATPVGLVLYAHRNTPGDSGRGSANAFVRVAGRLRGSQLPQAIGQLIGWALRTWLG